ncbi:MULTISPECIES: FAD-dependent oxidoreductase [unclassified Synechocystis]|uniref:FAD-dependent oxidoreductase n=1 Tax=unclassified Synechocystis TaxID=2640012 RepID=UPI0004292885|nr:MULTISPECIES: FAD-dependent oxidoreductase [unclassified Synechocystis]AIE75345.1 NADH dehydrogenase-like protein / Selenide,water dikinase [Synechocystis sp. PCC 6714]MCT0253580.1 FAD-dependent oxidoreductase [Synechocystis sp. CS-94]
MAKKLLLVGGGHSHALVLKHWSRHPLGNLELVLVSDGEQTPYSGMLPGHVAGFYSYAESHIDLPSLCASAGAEFINDRAIAVDPEQNLLTTEQGRQLSFDCLSLDIGSTPFIDDIAGAEYGIPAKPVPQFLAAWQALLEKIDQSRPEKFILAIAGGGAGGIELAFNLQARLAQLFPAMVLDIQIWQRGATLLPHHSVQGRKIIGNLLTKKNISVLPNHPVTAIEPEFSPHDNPLNPLLRYKLWSNDHSKSVNAVFLVTQASPAPWLCQSGLRLDDRGFVLIKPTLQSCSHGHIFAAGDVATMKKYPRPKAGVFAVRQGKPLFENLQRSLTHKPLKAFIPQSQYLSLLGTGDGRAMALWGPLASHGRCWWWLKDYIDRRFMYGFVGKIRGDQKLKPW